MATYKELVKAYDNAGRPSDTDAIRQLLIDAGLTHEQAVSAFEAAGQRLAPQPEETTEEEPQMTSPEGDPLANIEVPVGYIITSKTGKEFVWRGAQWTTNGKIVSKEYKDKVTQAAKQKIMHDEEIAKQDAEAANIEAQRTKDAEHEFENIPSGSSASREQHQAEQQPTQSNRLQDLAKKIQDSPKRNELIQRLVQSTQPPAENDRVAKLAAFIKANGQERQARAALGRYTDR